MTTAKAVCEQAAEIVGGDRQTTHGDKLACHEKIAALWNAYLSIRRDPAAPLDALDAAQMLLLMKIARPHSGAYHPDHYLDQTGYGAVSAEIAAKLRG